MTSKKLVNKSWLIKLLFLSLTTTIFGEILTVPIKISTEIITTTNFRITDRDGNDLTSILLDHRNISKNSTVDSIVDFEYQVRRYVVQTGGDAVLGVSANSKVKVELTKDNSGMKLKDGTDRAEILLDELSVSHTVGNNSILYEVGIPLEDQVHIGKISSKITKERILKASMGEYESLEPTYLTVTYTAE